MPDQEEGPLGPLRLTDRRGNIRKECSPLLSECSDVSNTSPSIIDPSSTTTRRRSLLARIFSKRKQDSQESSLCKGSISTDDSNLAKTSTLNRGLIVENGDTIRTRAINLSGPPHNSILISASQMNPVEKTSKTSPTRRVVFDSARSPSKNSPETDEVEDLVNACLDTSGIDRRYSAIIVEELRDCTNLTHDELRQAAHELTTTLGSNSPQYASFTSSTYDSAATRVPSSDELVLDSLNSYKNV